MRDGDDRARVVLEEALEPGDRLGVEVVGRLVEQQQVRRLQQQPAQRDAAALAARELGDVGVRRRQPQRVHRELELRVEIPGVARRRSCPGSATARRGPCPSRRATDPRRASRSPRRSASSSALVAATPSSTLPSTVLAGSSCGSCCRKPTEMPSAGNASPMKLLILAGHDLQQRALAGAVQAEHADLGAEENDSQMSSSTLVSGRMNLPETLHRVDELRHSQMLNCRSEFRLQNCRLASIGAARPRSPLASSICDRNLAINLQSAICNLQLHDPPDPPRRHGRVLRVGRAARRSGAARQAARRRRPARRPRRRRGGQLRSARVRRPLGDADGAGPCASARRWSSSGPTSRATRPRRTRCSRSSAR